MRDPNRIWPLMYWLTNVWRDAFPDMRFMQLMSNFTLWYGADPFYMEDDIFIEKFREFTLAMKGEKS